MTKVRNRNGAAPNKVLRWETGCSDKPGLCRIIHTILGSSTMKLKIVRNVLWSEIFYAQSKTDFLWVGSDLQKETPRAREMTQVKVFRVMEEPVMGLLRSNQTLSCWKEYHRPKMDSSSPSQVTKTGLHTQHLITVSTSLGNSLNWSVRNFWLAPKK